MTKRSNERANPVCSFRVPAEIREFFYSQVAANGRVRAISGALGLWLVSHLTPEQYSNGLTLMNDRKPINIQLVDQPINQNELAERLLQALEDIGVIKGRKNKS